MREVVHLCALAASLASAVAGIEATVTWKPNPHRGVIEMRIYQISQTGANIAGYNAFPYQDLKGTFTVLDGCTEIYGRAYTSAGKLSVESNILRMPCLCRECKGTIPQIRVKSRGRDSDGRIKALGDDTLTFISRRNAFYKIYCRPDLSKGDWEFVGAITSRDAGHVDFTIEPMEGTSCFYTMIRQPD
jgi:hypothetical protein